MLLLRMTWFTGEFTWPAYDPSGSDVDFIQAFQDCR